MTRESYRRKARETLGQAEQSDDPERQRKKWLEHLLHQAHEAEQSARTYEAAYAAAIDAMERAEAARRASQRAQKQLARLNGDKRREQERIRRNARQREAYRRRRATEGLDPTLAPAHTPSPLRSTATPTRCSESTHVSAQ